MADKNIQTELETLQLEESRFRVQELRNTQNNREIRRRSIETSLRTEAQRAAILHSRCKHRKGGLGVESLLNGNDANFAVAKHIMPNGVMLVVCQRCGREWLPPSPALISKGAPVEDRKLYSRLAQEYNEAVAFPTDNTTSGSQIFAVVDNRVSATA